MLCAYIMKLTRAVLAYCFELGCVLMTVSPANLWSVNKDFAALTKPPRLACNRSLYQMKCQSLSTLYGYQLIRMHYNAEPPNLSTYHAHHNNTTR